MATKSNVKEESFRLGCGRYLQSDGALALVGAEVLRLGACRPFILGGEKALALTKDRIAASLKEAGVEATWHTWRGFCDRDVCASLVASEAFAACDVVIGVGGGNVMDAAKYCAVVSGKPVINVPTSSATCAAYTPLSVCYNERGQTVGSSHHKTEVNCVIADMDVLCRQPERLLLSGVYDSLAKIYELKQRLLGVPRDEVEVGLYTSYRLSEWLTELLEDKLEECLEDVREGKNTKTVYDVVYALVAMTGAISGFARGSNQTAIAHKIYESLRALFPEEVYPYLHGEMVAMGLIVQIAYNGDEDANAFRERLARLGMPVCLSQIGVAPTEQNVGKLYDAMCASSAMAGTTDEEKEKLRINLALIAK